MNDKSKYRLVILLLLVFILLIYWNLYVSNNDKAKGQYKVFPDQVSSWISEDVIYDKDTLISLDPDAIVYKTFRKQGRKPVTLFIALYNTLEKADLSHSPIVCFTGQGWQVTDAGEKEITVNYGTNQMIKVNQLMQKKAETTMVTLYWYESKDHTFSNRGIQKIDLFLNKLKGKSDRNAFVRVTASISAGGDINALESDLQGFVHDFYPDLRRFLFEG